MDLDDFFEPPLHIVLGKGGVGKTTVAAVLALVAAERGRDTLICETEGKGGLSSAFGRGPLSYKEDLLAEGVWARTIWPEDSLIEYLGDHGMSRLSRYLAKTNAMEYVATAIPGIKDVLVLGKIKQIVRHGREADRDYATAIVDAPAAGHALTFLTSAVGILDAVKVGPIRDQARDVLEQLEDHAHTVVHLVTIPEETPVNETVETVEALREKLDCRLGAVFVNNCYPAADATISVDAIVELAAGLGTPVDDDLAGSLAAAEAFLAMRYEIQQEHRRRLASMLEMPQVELPFLFTAEFGHGELISLGAAMSAGIEAIGAAETAGAGAGGAEGARS